MAQTLFSLLLLRRLSLSSPTPTRLSRSFSAVKPLSTSSSPESNPPPSLSARMSFVFDQIDAMEKERSEKDETLHRIRAWRESRKPRPPEISSDLSKPAEAPGPSVDEKKPLEAETRSEVELVHPWPEWMELMERLVQQNYFDHRRKDEDKMIDDIGFYSATPRDSIAGDYSGVDFNNFKLVQTACINFGKDRFDILRPLSRQDIQTLVGFGCPSADKKVVFSSKLLRKRVHLDEGDVCSSCSLRNTCERAYLLTMKEDEARFIDIMRVLFAYGFDPMNKEVLNPSPMKQKSVKTIVRKLLHQVVKLSSVPIDPNLPPPIIKKPPPKVKQSPPPPRKRVGRSDIEMKKGDWLCPKCDFMNFAKNNVCLQCDAKRPKRQLLPGEWECPQCNFLNYRRNTVCFHCDCKRPPDEFIENKMPESHSSVRARAENMPINRSEVSSAWNFDFDDDESDGADVAAFEYADSSATEKGPFDNQGQGQKGNFAGPEFEPSRDVRSRDGEYSDADSGRARAGFDDFDDEEDDIDSYEIDTGNRNSVKMVSPDQIPTFDEDDSGSEDISGSRQNLQTHHRTKTSSFNSQSKPVNRKSFLGSDNDDDLDLAKPYSRNGTKSKVSLKRRAFSGSDDDELDSDSDSEISAKPKWKSSHVADSRPRGRDRFSKGPSRGLSFGSDDDDEPDRNFGSRRGKANNDIRTRGSSRMKKNRFSGSESEDEGPRPHGNRSRGSFGPSRGGRDSKGYSKSNSSRDTKFGSRGGAKNGRRDSFDDDDDDDSEGFSGSSRGSRGGRGGFRKNNAGPRTNSGNGFSKSFKEPRSGGFGQKSNFGERQSGGFRKQQGERRSERDSENRGSEDFKNSRRVIER